ncbi:beta-1,3-galactosyltransferase 5-like [Haliotis rufescens]|uniref:beta-1,3-galactosyltransferase 5-like n=1 Tax=Haliotis rufescens TaxID=6454 RepID=UPI00201F3380|nr:beta-1,3-galactosyltransferase 5-like [Haliotis rufescens]
MRTQTKLKFGILFLTVVGLLNLLHTVLTLENIITVNPMLNIPPTTINKFIFQSDKLHDIYPESSVQQTNHDDTSEHLYQDILNESRQEPMSEAPSRVRPYLCNNCFRHDFNYLIQNEEICRETSPGSVDLLMLILTAHGNTYRRNAIRSTWASISRNNTGRVRYVFLLGEVPQLDLMGAVLTEAMYHGDMLMEDFRDSYTNLTYKTIMGFQWATLYCQNAKFVFKTDDDMWINVPQLLKLTNYHWDFLQSGVLGSCGYWHTVIRDKLSKFYVSLEEYPYSYYPRYCSGSGYVTSMAVARQVVFISPHVPFLKFEDAYFGLCLNVLGTVDMASVDSFLYLADYTGDPCILKSENVTTCHSVPMSFFQMLLNAEC